MKKESYINSALLNSNVIFFVVVTDLIKGKRKYIRMHVDYTRFLVSKMGEA